MCGKKKRKRDTRENETGVTMMIITIIVIMTNKKWK